MTNINLNIISLTIILFLIEDTAFAYIGPGMTGGVLAATLGIIVAIFAAIFGLIWFPVKKMLKKKKADLKNDK